MQRWIQIGALTILVIVGSGQAFAQQTTASLDSAVAVASRWALQADANQADAMWQDSAETMRKSVKKTEWSHYLGTLRKQLGVLQSRDWLQLARVTNPNNLPAGEYVNVIFATKYANASTFETISLEQTASGWAPMGYVVRQMQAPTAATTPAAAK
ncbi:DUF4019 domain-containing protein [Dyella silvatica]|uniref:DUF4019 domain-containing protein n=1 Tax=Dyella silvatica TaxID=2992128 RepID=UPI00224FEAE9|nr:DUF4019 domain-containing protein [Dyella silvatica]